MSCGWFPIKAAETEIEMKPIGFGLGGELVGQQENERKFRAGAFGRKHSFFIHQLIGYEMPPCASAQGGRSEQPVNRGHRGAWLSFRPIPPH